MTVTDHIQFCEGNVIPQKEITAYPNNKTYMTKEVKDCINRKKLAFKNRDRAQMKIVQKELTQRSQEETQGDCGTI